MTQDGSHKESVGFQDPAERAARVLDATLTDAPSDDVVIVDERLGEKIGEALSRSAVTEDVVPQSAGEEERILTAPARERIRVLMVSADRSMFTAGSQAQARMQSYADVFDELHIIVLSLRTHELRPVRLAPNVWVYPTDSRGPWWAHYDAYKLALMQLSFSEGFRTDLVSVSNPFEVGLVGYFIARRFGRALHVELSKNPFDTTSSENRVAWRRMIARFVLRHADGIRVTSNMLKTMLEKRYKKRVSGKIDVLPTFSDVSLFRDAEPSFNLHERYPGVKFIVLTAVPLTAEGRVREAIDACTVTLRQYPTIGLVIVGEGPLRAELEKYVVTLGLQNQVSFEGYQDDMVSYYKGANLFLHTSGYEEYGTVLTEAAASGLPVLTADAGIASELFHDGTNGFLCPVGDVACFERRISDFLNNNQLRLLFSRDAQERVFRLIDSNVEGYREAFVSGMVACVSRHATAETNTVTS